MGSRKTLYIAILILAFGFISFHITVNHLAGAIVSSLLQGFGYGLFIPVAMVYAKSQLTHKRIAYYFGLYASMVPLPNLVGPSLAHSILDSYGVEWFFIITAIPILLVLGLFFLLSKDGSVKNAVNARYFEVLKKRGLMTPYLAAAVLGLLSGLVPSYMAEILIDRHLPMSLFFTSSTAIMFISRFTIAGFFEHTKNEHIVSASFAMIATAYLTLAYNTSASGALLSGILFGAGHSLAYPRISLWVSEQFKPNERQAPVSLFNIFFTSGFYFTPLLIGSMKAFYSIETLMCFLATIAFSYVLIFGCLPSNTAQPERSP